ncbi:Vacuolar iron transporter 1 [Geodia barretti]|uniref:Vacuolar iron transporter 1 n=1 Tax=Geodia barretti TaxID=519541 RepID=A0AA35TGC7_GEOBA|nr:Vacuolar iron transporter 1 [Geodia barretti]
MADEISQDRDLWLKTLVEKELGISTEETASPVKDAMVMGLAFITGAAIPLVPHFFLTGDTAIGVSVGGTLAGLFALGLLKGRLVERSPLLQGLEILGIGTISAGVGYALGELIPRLFT